MKTDIGEHRSSGDGPSFFHAARSFASAMLSEAATRSSETPSGRNGAIVLRAFPLDG
jgi:hypothetical protein